MSILSGTHIFFKGSADCPQYSLVLREVQVGGQRAGNISLADWLVMVISQSALLILPAATRSFRNELKEFDKITHWMSRIPCEVYSKATC